MTPKTTMALTLCNQLKVFLTEDPGCGENPPNECRHRSTSTFQKLKTVAAQFVCRPSVFQATIWTTKGLSKVPLMEGRRWQATSHLALGTPCRDVFHLDVKYTCTSTCSLGKGTKSKLKRTRL